MDQKRIIGSLLGTAIGDAIGLPYEGLGPQRARKLLGTPHRHRLLFDRGLVSDDTEHACIVAQALIASGDDLNQYRQQLAKRLRWWLLGLPAGIGMATLRALIKLWLGYPPQRSGVFSAGNGPAMRAPLLGTITSDTEELRHLVDITTDITHRDPKAKWGAYAVALAAQFAAGNEAISPDVFLTRLQQSLPEEATELLQRITDTVESCNRGEPTTTFAARTGHQQGVSGYVYHTVPVALHAWLSHPQDYRAAITSAINCGGDTDTVAAIVGGIVGARVGREGIPTEWIDGLLEWPRSISWMERLARQLAHCRTHQITERPLGLPVIAIGLRNLFFLMVVLTHGFRRLLPPY